VQVGVSSFIVQADLLMSNRACDTKTLIFFIELSLYIALDINIARDRDLLFNSNIAKNLRNHFDFLYQQI
jgi:hypothetical protein